MAPTRRRRSASVRCIARDRTVPRAVQWANMAKRCRQQLEPATAHPRQCGWEHRMLGSARNDSAQVRYVQTALAACRHQHTRLCIQEQRRQSPLPQANVNCFPPTSSPVANATPADDWGSLAPASFSVARYAWSRHHQARSPKRLGIPSSAMSAHMHQVQPRRSKQKPSR